MKRILLVLLLVLSVAGLGRALVLFQRPNPTVVGGATSSGTSEALLTDSNGNLYTLPGSGSVQDVNVKQVNGGTVTTAAGTSAGTQRVTISTEPVTAIVPGVAALSDYTGTGSTVTTLSATSGTSLTTNTLYINSLRCHNGTGGAITVSRTDTAGTTFEVTQSIAANSSAYLESPGSWTQMAGLKLWASAVSSLHCTMSAKN